VKRALWSRIVARAGWLTCAGWLNAFTIVQMCGIDVESTTNGRLQPVVTQIQRYSSQRATREASTRTTVAARRAVRARAAIPNAWRATGPAAATWATRHS